MRKSALGSKHAGRHGANLNKGRMKMIISIKQLQHHQCPKKPLHHKTAYVFFTERGAISTDGRKLMIVPYPEDEKTHDTPKSEKDAIAVHMDQCGIVVDFIKVHFKKRGNSPHR